MKKLIRALLATCAALGLTVVALPASPAAAASCISPVFKVYPGSVPSNIRYGEVDFQMIVCDNWSPQQFTLQVTKAQVNATGQAIGFYIDGTGITTDLIGSYTRYWTGHIYSSTCTPKVHWPCVRTYSFEVELVGTLENYTHPNAWMGTRSAPSGMALFTTP